MFDQPELDSFLRKACEAHAGISCFLGYEVTAIEQDADVEGACLAAEPRGEGVHGQQQRTYAAGQASQDQPVDLDLYDVPRPPAEPAVESAE